MLTKLAATQECETLLSRLEADLVGPLSPQETLTEGFPSDVYLTGILWPRGQTMGAEEAERLDSAGSGAEDELQGAAEEVPLNGLRRPCTAGLSFAVSTLEQPTIGLSLAFALYEPKSVSGDEAPLSDSSSVGGSESTAESSVDVMWVRRPFQIRYENLELPSGGYERKPVVADGVPAGIFVYLRAVPAGPILLVTATVINEMAAIDRSRPNVERVTMFQVALEIRPAHKTTLVPKPQVGRPRNDDEELSAALLYRDCKLFAVGHTCSVDWDAVGNIANAIRTSWLPRAEVSRVSAQGDAAFAELSADKTRPYLEAQWLAGASSADIRSALGLLAKCYERWIEKQEQRVLSLSGDVQAQALQNLSVCKGVQERLSENAVAICDDAKLLESFQLANRAIQLQHEWNPDRKGDGPMAWRPFQLAFIVLAAPSCCRADDRDRGVMDLLWFPTGGGKTEAYLGLIAITAFHRRLSRPDPDTDIGVAAVMRYTLRLLTTQQFLRATALILACEVIRRGGSGHSSVAARLGARPFSIGLWLGGDATPNNFEDAQRALKGDKSVASPEQVLVCPCCQSRLIWKADAASHTVSASCPSGQCLVAKQSDVLPVWTVDTDVYRESPTLLIGTVDKFAQMPRRDEVRRLFGVGTAATPDLVIQDELHLISGPLGTVTALYEVAFDWLARRDGSRPKIIGSTATIRRARHQALALFDRVTRQFPPPGVDHSDSGFAVSDTSRPGRLYVAVPTAGRSAKFALQAVAGCLLQVAFGALQGKERRDPYSTLVAYFNSLRELGGALVLMQDDVEDSVRLYAGRHAEPAREARNIEELTSRRTQEEVRDMLGKLAIRCGDDGSVDAVLATNMVSVGVDVPRLGLMLVNGQPKTRSEYIQATSRVGRDKAQGLVVVLLNSAKPRDRSHYESFPVWHQSLYRDVEATSVTPFASRARDRALRAVLASMVRHGAAGLSASPQNLAVDAQDVRAIVEEILRRADAVDPSERGIAAEIERSLADWEVRRPKLYWNDYRPSESLLQSAERAAALKAMGRAAGDAWPTLNNMRSVEPSVRFRLAERLRSDASEGDGGGNG